MSCCLLIQLERFTSMRMKKDKEKPGHNPNQRHSSAANYEINAQSAMMHSHSDEYVLELFEQMLVRKIFKVYVYCVCVGFIISPRQPWKLVLWAWWYGLILISLFLAYIAIHNINLYVKISSEELHKCSVSMNNNQITICWTNYLHFDSAYTF